MKKLLFSCLVLSTIFISCKSSKHTAKNNEKMNSTSSVSADQQTIVYKTTKDFSELVPVTMNAEKTEIISYPSPADIFYNGVLAKPTVLKNGYLLDNRGINENVVFLNYTYENYSKFKEVPSMAELMLKIVDKYPISEMYYCGPRLQFKDEVKELNTLIDKGFTGCKKAEITVFQINFQE